MKVSMEYIASPMATRTVLISILRYLVERKSFQLKTKACNKTIIRNDRCISEIYINIPFQIFKTEKKWSIS